MSKPEPPPSLRQVAFEMQQLLVDDGFDVDVAVRSVTPDIDYDPPIIETEHLTRASQGHGYSLLFRKTIGDDDQRWTWRDQLLIYDSGSPETALFKLVLRDSRWAVQRAKVSESYPAWPKLYFKLG